MLVAISGYGHDEASPESAILKLSITKAGNVYLRSLLIECANHILRPHGRDSVLGALLHVQNRYQLCRLASKATQRLRKPNHRVEATISDEIGHFLEWVDFAGNGVQAPVAPVTDKGLTFSDFFNKPPLLPPTLVQLSTASEMQSGLSAPRPFGH